MTALDKAGRAPDDRKSSPKPNKTAHRRGHAERESGRGRPVSAGTAAGRTTVSKNLKRYSSLSGTDELGGAALLSEATADFG
eukprot:scaffold34079_cov33-Phaeocystis_antarctica.AAC.1